MNPLIIILLILFFGFVAPAFVLSAVIYTAVLVRTNPKKWSRECSLPEDAELVRIYEDGAEWAARHRGRVREVSITNDGFRLVGEYFDFGGDSCVIVIPGRMEGLRYSYHFAIPYHAAGCNVLVIDNRSHGLSEGRFNSLGYKEYRDVIAWARLLHDELGNARVILHGICIGSSTALFAATSPDCPDYIVGMVADGMYTRFYETFKMHMIEMKRPLFPFLYIVMLYIRIFAGADVVRDGPIFRVGNMTKPILFLHSRADTFSLPDKAQLLFDRCASEHKSIHWFPSGAHSRIRINHPDEYDAAVRGFVESVTEKVPKSAVR